MVQRLSCEEVRLSTLTDVASMTPSLFAKGLMFPVKQCNKSLIYALNFNSQYFRLNLK